MKLTMYLTRTNLTGLNGLGSGFGRLLNCLIISLMLLVGSGFGFDGAGVGAAGSGSASLAGGVLG